MRDSKSLLLLWVSLILLFLSIAVLGTLGYYYFNKEQGELQGVIMLKGDSTQVRNQVRDSLQKEYTDAITNLDRKVDSVYKAADSLKATPVVNMEEFTRLKKEITDILRDKSSNADLGLARQKIGELQRKVEDLRTRNKDIENENKRLIALLAQLSNNQKTEEQNIKRADSDNKVLNEKMNAASASFVVTDIQLSALQSINNKDEETILASETEKLVGSFTVHNTASPLSPTEMMVVIIQPDGEVLKSSPWESGTFQTRDGKKIYSYKMRFDYSKGETKRLQFSISNDRYQKGNYTVQIYHNGQLIGKLNKALS